MLKNAYFFEKKTVKSPQRGGLSPRTLYGHWCLYAVTPVCMGVGSGEQGAVAPLDFQTWYKYSVDRGLNVLFRPFFAIFRSFFPLPPSPPGRG